MNGINLIRPLEYSSELEAEQETGDKVCSRCFSIPAIVRERNGKYILECPDCGPIYPHGLISRRTATIVNNGIRLRKAELAAEDMHRLGMGEDEIIASLGF